jgi:hypothetical protein
MSTKTTFKRIALVAVAALGLGVLSVAPSQATVSGISVTVGGTATSAAGQSDSLTAATIAISGFMDNAKDTITVQFIEDGARPTAVTGYTAGVPKLAYLETSTATTDVAKTAGTLYTTHQTGPTGDSVTVSTALQITPTAANRAVGAKFTLQLDSVTAPLYGTYNYTAVVKQYSYSLGDTLTMLTTTYPIAITVAKPASIATTAAAAKQFSRLGLSAAPTADGSDDVLTAVSTIGTVAGYLTVGVRNASDAQTAQDSVTATITGAGVLCQSTTCGKSFILAATGDAQFTIKADGTAGVGTISTKTNTVTFSNKTVSFYAKAAKTVTATVANPVLAIGANESAISATAVDANGTTWTGAMYIVASAAADALVGGSATTPVACSAYDTTDLVHYCPVTTIAAGTAKFKLIDASTVALATATSNEVTVTVSAQKAATIKLAFDKATYAPFEKAKITITPVDAAGAAIAAQTAASLVTVAGITGDYAFSAGSDTLTAAGGITTSALTGSKTYTVYMPAAGTVTITATGGTALSAAGQVAVTATASVVNSSVDAATDAANEATDAANAATDAALAAADAADAATAAAQDASDAVAALSATVAKLVASLKAQITSLTNLVIKIQKKVRA